MPRKKGSGKAPSNSKGKGKKSLLLTPPSTLKPIVKPESPLSPLSPTADFHFTYHFEKSEMDSAFTYTSDEDDVPLFLLSKSLNRPKVRRNAGNFGGPDVQLHRQESHIEDSLSVPHFSVAPISPPQPRPVMYWSTPGAGSSTNIKPPLAEEPATLCQSSLNSRLDVLRPWLRYSPRAFIDHLPTQGDCSTQSMQLSQSVHQEFRNDVLAAVARMSAIFMELECKIQFLQSIDMAALESHMNKLLFRKTADREVERVLLTLEGAVCEFRNAAKVAFHRYLADVNENDWVLLTLRSLEEPARPECDAVLQNIREEVTKIVVNQSGLALSYDTAIEGGMTPEELRPLCPGLLEAIFSSTYKIKQFINEMELSIKHQLWTIR